MMKKVEWMMKKVELLSMMLTEERRVVLSMKKQRTALLARIPLQLPNPTTVLLSQSPALQSPAELRAKQTSTLPRTQKSKLAPPQLPTHVHHCSPAPQKRRSARRKPRWQQKAASWPSWAP